MKVILLKDVPNVGRKNDVKDVSEGYARNFLLAKKLAVPATDNRIQAMAQRKLQKDERVTAERETYQRLAEKLTSVEVVIPVKAGEKGKAFGSVSAAKIVESLKKQGIELDSEWLDVEGPIKTTGTHEIAVTFPHGVTGSVRVEIMAEHES